VELKNYSDVKLIELTSKNNILGLEELYKRYSKVLFTLISKICTEPVLAEQVLKQVFIIIFNKAKHFPIESDNVYSWILLLARNRAVDSLRRNRTSESIEISYDDAFENKYILPTLSKYVDGLDIETAIRIANDMYSAYYKLTDMQRRVIELAFYEGFSINEIALNLKLPVEAIRSKIMISVFTLRDKLMKIDSKDLPDNNLIFEFISAFSLGCLDRKNYDMFLDYYYAGKLSDDELSVLGVIQNIVSLIPLSLDPKNLEQNIYDDIKAAIVNSGVIITEDIVENNEISTSVELKSELANKKKNEIDTNETESNIPKTLDNKDILEESTDELKVEIKNKKANIYSGIKGLSIKYKYFLIGSLALSAILVIFLIVVSVNSSATINDLENRLEIAEEKASKSFEFVKDYQTYIDFTNQGNFKVIQLKDTSGFVAARLFLSLNSEEGLLQIDNLPKIQSDEEYSLQTVKGGVSKRLITFLPDENSKYISLNNKSNSQLLSSDLFKIVIHKKSKKQAEGTPLFWGN